MTSSFRQFANHYAVLALLLSLGVAGIAWFRSDPTLQQLALWGTLFGYVAWGVGHHLLRKNLTATIVLEYILIAGIAGYFTQTILLSR